MTLQEALQLPLNIPRTTLQAGINRYHAGDPIVVQTGPERVMSHADEKLLYSYVGSCALRRFPLDAVSLSMLTISQFLLDGRAESCT